MIGTRLADRYEIVGELGRGGMGVVYRARDPLLDREVAIKVVPPTMLTPDAELRFQREAQVVARMDHPAIVTVYDIGRHEGSLFFVMPVIGGTNLRVLLRERSLRLGDVVDLASQVADALDYSHSQGVVHRDIKPENIMVWRTENDNLRVRIMDFGLARASLESQLTRITHSGTIIGTVSYFSPEQVSATSEVDARSDIYSFGTVLYECLLGEPPFAGEVQSVLYRIVHENPQPPTQRGADVDFELEQIAMRCLAREPSGRPQTAREVADALARYRLGLNDDDRQRPIAMASTRLSRPEPVQRELAPFTGRDRELTELQHRLNAAVNGECQIAIVGGEPGIGKSRLLEEIERLAKARRIHVLHGRFVELDRSFPFQGFCEAIQEYFRSRETASSSTEIADFSDLAPELAYLFPVLAEIGDIRSASADSKADHSRVRRVDDRTAIFELLARVIARISSGRPLVLLLEDLHDADVSIEALQYIVRRLGPTPTFIIGTYRTGDVDRRHAISRLLDSFHGDRRFVHLLLGPMTAIEHRAFVEALIGSGRLGDSLSRTLFDATEGNPFFTKELVRSLVDSGGIAEDDVGTLSLSSEMGLTSDALPETIQQVVEKQIERLDENDREILSMAAVLGRTFEYRDLEALADGRGADIEDAVDRLLRQGMLEEERESRGDRMSFASGVVREALYAGLSRRKRRSLHRRYAEWTDARNGGKERFWASLAHHYSHGDVADKAVEYGLKAARKSLDAFSTEEAILSARTALEFLEDDEWNGDRSLEGEARLLLSGAWRIEGNIEGAVREVERAIRIFERERNTPRLVAAFLFAAETAWEGRRIEETRRWVDRGLEVARSIGDQEARSRLLSLGATVANLRGEYDAAREYLEEIELLRPEGPAPEVELPVGGTLCVGMPGRVDAREPSAITTVDEEEVLSSVFECLFSTDEQGTIQPLIGEKWELRDGGRSIFISLRSDVRFSNGEPLTADDVRLTFERAIRIDPDSPSAIVATVVGATEFARGEAEHLAGVVVRSDSQVEIKLTETVPIYPTLLSDPGAGIVRVTRNEDGTEAILGTGRFRVESAEPKRIVLARNESYWGGAPTPIDRIEFQTRLTPGELAARFRAGQLDIVHDLLTDDLDRILRDQRSRAQLSEAPRKNVALVVFNLQSELFRDVSARRALAGVVRTQDLIWQSMGRFAVPATGLIPPGMLGHDPGRRRTPISIDQALAQMTSHGFTAPMRVSAAIPPGLSGRYGELLRALFGAWRDLGVQVLDVTPDEDSYARALNSGGGVDLIVLRWNADYDDPDNFTYGLFHSQVGILRNFFSSPETDAIAEEARAERSAGIRETLYRKFEHALLDGGIIVPLFHEVNYRLSSSLVRGIRVRGNAPCVNYAEVGKASESGDSTPVAPRRSSGGTIYVPGGATKIESLDPSYISTLSHGEVIPNIFETLTRVIEGARVVPWLAAAFQVEEGGRRFRFHLRDDVRFHDGRRLTSRDVRYTFERFLLDPNGTNRRLLLPIRGARAMIEGEAGDLEGFRILSAVEFTIELEMPLLLFSVMLTNAALAIIPEGSSGFDTSWRETCVGTGPFRVLQFDPGRRLELERNPDYWRAGYPKSDGLVFIFGLTSGQILGEFRAGRLSLATDLSTADVDSLRHDSDFASCYREMPRLSSSFVTFNTHRGPLADVDVRRWLTSAIDTASIVRRVLGRFTMPAHGLIPPGLLGYETPRGTTGSGALPRILDEPIELTAVTNAIFTSRYLDLTTELLETMKRMGARVNLETVSPDELFHAQSSGSVDMVINAWVADYPDADSFARGLLHSEDGVLGAMLGSKQLDALVERGRIETDPSVRHGVYRQMEDLLIREAVLLPLFHPRNYRIARPELEGLAITSYTYPSVAYESLWVK